MSGTLQNIDIKLNQEISKIYKKSQMLLEFQKLTQNIMANLNYEINAVGIIVNISIVPGDNIEMEKPLSVQLEEKIYAAPNKLPR
ncbi:hypothetical protein [Patiriisocius sp. Uisw_017]|jgi:hypothetical protein|uniref:hypothetical protein n=1 Tax=Patiriisocius sp. Uisw_017 TaxID=3230968 RepID=UPI0039EB87D3